jgi:phosphocarrier protein HPr
LPVRNAVVQADVGLHARPAALFVRAVLETGLPVTISRDGRPAVDARSLLEVMTEDFQYGCEVQLAVAPGGIPERCSARDVEAALDGLRAVLESTRPR